MTTSTVNTATNALLERIIDVVLSPDTSSGNDLCVRIYGIRDGLDVWLDAGAVAQAGGIYEYLNEQMDELAQDDRFHDDELALSLLETLRESITQRDIIVVDTDGDLASFATEGEWFNVERYNEATELVAEGTEVEALLAAEDCGISLANFNEAYRGRYESPEDMAQSIWGDCGYLAEMPAHAVGYIDWAAVARDMLLCDMSSSRGHYFWTHYSSHTSGGAESPPQIKFLGTGAYTHEHSTFTGIHPDSYLHL